MKIVSLNLGMLIISIFLTGCNPSNDVPEGLTFEQYVQLAEDYHNEDNSEKAIASYKKALLIRPKEGYIHFRLGLLYEREYSRSFDEASRKGTLDALLNPNKRIGKDVIKVHENFGLKSEYQRLAMQEFRETIKYDPDNWRARSYLAGDYRNNGQYDEAIREYRNVIVLKPDYVSSYISLAEVYEEKQMYDQAIEHLQAALKLDSVNEYAYYKLGVIYKKAGQGEKVHDILLKLESMNSFWYNELRHALFRR